MPKLPVDDTEKFAVWMIENFDIDGETLMFAPAKGFFKDKEEGKSHCGPDALRWRGLRLRQVLQPGLGLPGQFVGF